MTQSSSQKTVRRGRIFPEIQWTPEEKARYKAEKDARFGRCKAIFEQVKPQLIEDCYGWYIAIEPISGDYFIDADKNIAHEKAREKYPDIRHCLFCLNETGACGRI
jgi:hypothetical protein